MASADYHTCDHCGERKTFYDAHMEVKWVDGHWRYNWAKGGDGYPAFPGYRIFSLCNECEKTHEIIIRPKAADRDAPHIMPPPIRDSGPLESMEGDNTDQGNTNG